MIQLNLLFVGAILYITSKDLKRKKKSNIMSDLNYLLNGGPLETRTPDPLIKSQLLYQLS